MRKQKVKKAPPGAMRTLFAGMTALGILSMRGAHASGLAGWRGPLFDPGTDDAGADDDIATSMKACRDNLTALNTAMDTLEKQIEADQGDETAKSALSAQYQAKSLEFDKAKKQFERMKGKASRRNLIGEANSMSNVVRPGAIPNGVPAQAKDHDAEDAAQCKAFTNYIIDPINAARAIPEQLRDTLKPEGKSWAKAEGGWRVPKSMRDKLMPSIMQGKALPLTSDQAGPELTYQAEMMRELLKYKGESSKLFPRCRRIPCVAGIAKWARLKQAAPTAKGTPGSFGEYGGVAVSRVAEGASAPEEEPQFEQVLYQMYPIRAMTQLTTTVISRMGTTFDVVSLLNELFPEAINHLLDLEIISGSGVGEMEGIVTNTSVPSVFRAAVNDISHPDYINIETPIPPDYRDEMVYLIADAAWQAYKKKTDTTGRPLYLGWNQAPTDPTAKIGSIRSFRLSARSWEMPVT